MKLQKIIDLIEGKTSLHEMSFSANQIRQRFMDDGLRNKRFTNLILIYYFRNKQESDHWIGELTGFVPESPFIKGRNRRLDYNETYHCLWKGQAEDYSKEEFQKKVLTRAKDAKETKRKKKENKNSQKITKFPWDSLEIDIEGALSFMEEFHKWASSNLVEAGFVKCEDIRIKISSLLH